MVTRKNTSQQLKKKISKYETDLEKLQEQKRLLSQKEKEILKNVKEAKSDYIIALMAESGKTIEELELFAKTEKENHNSSSENGDVAHVSNN